ncbi:hypothetical protein AB6A40_001483 [Gnathostoma spinigerum]|uniref:PH domain-containing protein n=1 Tax=Gnathostoma spinigerum TaxID=75299 RepID=A0ABD6E495_9BILA
MTVSCGAGERSTLHYSACVSKMFEQKCETQRCKMDPVLKDFLRVFQGKLFSKWKRYLGAVFEENQSGKARLEMYSSDSQIACLRPAQIIVLSECLAIRLVNFIGQEVIQIQQRNTPVVIIAVEETDRWHQALCKAAFPSQFHRNTISGTPVMLSDEYDEPWDVCHVSIIPRRSAGLPDGIYELYFNKDFLIIKKDSDIEMRPWLYSQIMEVAAGSQCVGIMFTDRSKLEFMCRMPSSVIDSLQRRVGLRRTDARFYSSLSGYLDYYVPISRTNDWRSPIAKVNQSYEKRAQSSDTRIDVRPSFCFNPIEQQQQQFQKQQEGNQREQKQKQHYQQTENKYSMKQTAKNWMSATDDFCTYDSFSELKYPIHSNFESAEMRESKHRLEKSIAAQMNIDLSPATPLDGRMETVQSDPLTLMGTPSFPSESRFLWESNSERPEKSDMSKFANESLCSYGGVPSEFIRWEPPVCKQSKNPLSTKSNAQHSRNSYTGM